MSKTFFGHATIFKTFRRFILLNLLIATILMLAQCPECFLSFDGLNKIKVEYIFSFLMSSSISFGGFKVEEFYEKRVSWIKAPLKRFILTSSTYLTYTFIVSFILISAYVLINVEEVGFHNISWAMMARNTIYPILVALIIITIFISRSWLFEWRNAALEAEQLKTAMLSSQNQFLKDQLNPHFLFNSLNTLSNLVFDDAAKSADFIQQLSKIYRYVLDVQQEELVTLEQELDFAENYLSLQKIRLDSSLNYSILVSEKNELYLPPLSLQLLLENAIKHNIASMEKPLRIKILQEKDKLIVQNNLQLKTIGNEGGKGIGLENIIKRYQLLSDKKPLVFKDQNIFSVELPLLSIYKYGNTDH
ncbi:MAG: histidine kinase [Cyclobacteriaceae bacterium]|nr:histidine kinase [Cyclobacteriaceae bacterium]